MNDVDTRAFEQVLAGIGDQEIVSLEARIRAVKLNELISDDLLFTGPNGQPGNKAQDIEHIGRVRSNFLHMFLKSFVSAVSLRMPLTKGDSLWLT